MKQTEPAAQAELLAARPVELDRGNALNCDGCAQHLLTGNVSPRLRGKPSVGKSGWMGSAGTSLAQQGQNIPNT